MLSECIIETHFPSKGEHGCESDYRPIEDNTSFSLSSEYFLFFSASLDAHQNVREEVSVYSSSAALPMNL